MATHAGYAMRVVSRGLFPPLRREENLLSCPSTTLLTS